MSEKRSSFTGKLGFVLAAAGSAVGLGNIWRFPYLVAKHGGGIFLLVYVILAITFGNILMNTEIALGRKTKKSAIGAFTAVNKKYSFIGILTTLVPVLILPYYSVIGGWVLKYFTSFALDGASASASDGYFSNFISDPALPIIFFLVFVILTSTVIFFGVEKGIESVSKVMMPLLVAITVFISVYTMFIPGAIDGVLYYISPDFSKLSVNTVLAALGQLFYSLSIAMGIMITYGSYMKKDVDIQNSVKQIEIFDMGVAFFAGLMIVPAVFVFSGGNESALNSGPGLMFETLPKVFESMPGGHFIGILFFMLVLLAALTSSISLMETIVSIISDKFGWSRKVCCVVVLIATVIMGIPSALGFSIWQDFTVNGMSILDMFDFLSNSILVPIIAILTCLFIGFVAKPRYVIDELELTRPYKNKKYFEIVIKYIAPICIILIMISSLLDIFGIYKM